MRKTFRRTHAYRAVLVSRTVIQMVAPESVWLKNLVGCTIQPTTIAAAAKARAAKGTGTAHTYEKRETQRNRGGGFSKIADIEENVPFSDLRNENRIGYRHRHRSDYISRLPSLHQAILQRQHMRRSIGLQQPGTKSGRGVADKPDVNRS